MIKEILRLLKLEKKQDVDVLRAELNKKTNELEHLKESLQAERKKNQDAENMIISMCRETHIVYETQRGNNFIYLSKETLEKSKKYNLVKKVDMHNRIMLIAEKKEKKINDRN